MSILSALRRAVRVTLPGDALYHAIVAEARRPDWYLAGEVPDTMDGRFDMVALVLSLVMIRLEEAGEAQLCADLTERFIADMDGSLRQDGVGDQVVGKHIGRMVAALGGRLGAYRDSRGDDFAFADALRRNLWRGEPINDAAVEWVVAEARRVAARLQATPIAALTAGSLAPVSA
ncbi:MAG: ubiquinol-cytochrome C chaperone family protein [Polymorphobacter sp.]